MCSYWTWNFYCLLEPIISRPTLETTCWIIWWMAAWIWLLSLIGKILHKPIFNLILIRPLWYIKQIIKKITHIIQIKDKFYYVEMTESLDIPFNNMDELKKNWNKYILNKGHIEKVNYEVYRYIKGKYCKLLNKKDIICVDLIPKKEFSLWWSAFLYKMPRKQCKNWYLPVIFWDWHTYIYDFEYKKYKNNFTKVLDKDLLK